MTDESHTSRPAANLAGSNSGERVSRGHEGRNVLDLSGSTLAPRSQAGNAGSEEVSDSESSRRVRNLSFAVIDQICSSPEFLASARRAALAFERTAVKPGQIEGRRSDVNLEMSREHSTMPRLRGNGRGQL